MRGTWESRESGRRCCDGAATKFGVRFDAISGSLQSGDFQVGGYRGSRQIADCCSAGSEQGSHSAVLPRLAREFIYVTYRPQFQTHKIYHYFI